MRHLDAAPAGQDHYQPEADTRPTQGRQGARVSHRPWGRSSRPGSKPTAASWSRVSLRMGGAGDGPAVGSGAEDLIGFVCGLAYDSARLGGRVASLGRCAGMSRSWACGGDGHGFSFWVWGGEDSGNGSGSAGARLPDFVGAVESGACDDMSGHGVECVGEGELVGQVELVVQGEELEDVGVWSV